MINNYFKKLYNKFDLDDCFKLEQAIVESIYYHTIYYSNEPMLWLLVNEKSKLLLEKLYYWEKDNSYKTNYNIETGKYDGILVYTEPCLEDFDVVIRTTKKIIRKDNNDKIFRQRKENIKNMEIESSIFGEPKVDLGELRCKVDNYESQYGEKPFLIMTADTFHKMVESSFPELLFEIRDKVSWNGCNVAYANYLPYGKVIIR